MDVYYFYNGFCPPEKVNIDDLIITSNYRGDVTDIFTEEHNHYKDESYRLYNEMIWGYFGIMRNPTLEELQECNSHFGLDNNDYLGDFILAAVS